MMQLNCCLSRLCESVLTSNSRYRTAVANIHLLKALSAKSRALAKEKTVIEDSWNDAETGRPTKKVLRISCKRPEFNFHEGETYNKFDNIPLASNGWHHSKSRGDFFTFLGHRENPAVSSSPDSNCSFNDIGIDNNVIQILDDQNITSPTIIQKDGIPSILKGNNSLVTAETGCGKTLAYLLPMIQQILNWQLLLKDRPLNSPLGIVVSPNRELANQIGEVAMAFSRRLGFTTRILTGGHTKRKMLNPSFDQVDLMVASFGALSKLISAGIINIKNVHHVVLDEADTLFDDSFNIKLHHFLKRFQFQFRGNSAPSALSTGVQLTLVSATMPTSLPELLHDVVEAESLVRVTTSQTHHILPHVPQKFYRLSKSQKPVQLLTLVKKDVAKKAPVIIFSNKSSTCDWISMFLNENGVECVHFNGKMLLDIRNGKLNKFLSGAVNVISCTDIGSRGINTIRVKHVINYDFPFYTADYIHRCGRTGRVGSVEGCHVSNFVATPGDVDLVQKIETAARRMDALPNVNGNIKRTITYRVMKKLEKESV